MVFHIIGRRHFGNLLELPIKVRNVVEPRLVTNTGNVVLVFYKLLTGIPYSDLVQISGKRFSMDPFKEPAKGRGVHVGRLGGLFGAYLLLKVLEHKLIYLVEVFVRGRTESI